MPATWTSRFGGLQVSSDLPPAMAKQDAEITYLSEGADAGQVVDAEVLPPQGQPCDACGAPVEDHDKFCPHCGVAVERAAPAANVAPAAIRKHIQCQTCGSRIATDPDQRSYACPFCDSTYVVEYSPEISGRQPPEFVIGFAVTHEQALEKFRQWIRDNSVFRPGDLAQSKIEDKLRGVYLPFWRFTMLARSQWSGEIGEYWYRTETYTTTDSKGNRVTRTRRVQETEWWPLSGRHHFYHRDYLVSGSRGLPQDQAQRIMPYNLPALARYEPWYLAGWLDEEYSVDEERAMQICRQEFQRREEANIASFLPGDTHRGLRVVTQFSHETSDLCLLPVYLVSYRYQDKLYRFLINGQTGRVSGDKPWSWKRIGAFSAVIVALVILLVLVLMCVWGAFAVNA